jgi:predicted nucleic acid-binding protein
LRLIVDANVLVSELLRDRGRRLLAHRDLDLNLTERAWSEARYELTSRLDAMVRRERITPERREQLLELVFELAIVQLTVQGEQQYSHAQAEARRRIPRDPDDWPTVALALALGAAIWTHDHDFLGCGLPTWTTETLLLQLAAGAPGA